MPAVGLALCDLPPATSKTAILSLDVVDAVEPRVPPLITVFADGRLEVRAPPPSSRVLTGRIPRTEVEGLWAEVIVRERFLQIDGADLSAEIAIPPSTGQGIFTQVMADAPWSFLSVETPACRHEVRVEGSALLSLSRRDIDALVRFRRAEVRLLELATAVQLAR